ncbi:hypothetical protein WMY93_017429 [Mugilogobius chulae]|uniref:Centrosomal protein kizuna n=1 Tax=Mugilogobius chulae TaxID=88201 RepID=A0AAW0NT48_9GOBI
MHRREKRRLELERELFAFCRSDKRISQIKCSNLRNYLRQISDREERAKLRNLDLLREVESIENSMKTDKVNLGPLLQLKANVRTTISKSMDTKKQTNQEAESTKVKVMDCQSFMDPVFKSSTQSVMDQQIQVCSNLLPSSPKSSLLSYENLPCVLLKDSRTDREGTVSNQEYLSDDISSSNDPQDVYNLSDKHERTIAELPTICALTVSVPSEHKLSPLVTLTAAGDRPASCSSGPLGAEKPIGEDEQTSHSPAMENAGNSDISLSSEENLSLSLTQSELDEDLSESGTANKHDFFQDNDNRCQYSPKSLLHAERFESPINEVTLKSLSLKGFFKLLDTIEERLHLEQSKVYSDSLIDAQELSRIISLCNSEEDLNGEDPKACSAVVLHELQRLSCSTEKGCLLPLDLVNAYQSCTNTNKISDCLLPDAAQLWDRWFKHALLLKERHVLTTEHLVQLFTPLLLERHATYVHQAKVLLRTLLSRSSEECPSAGDESDVSSFGSAPLPDSRLVRPLQKQQSPELQSSEEDSQDESPVESVPIRESKAYQLLKQSAMQKRVVSCKEEDDEECDDLSGLGWAKHSLHQDPYLGILGESDDSYSEIEAALRPQSFNNVDTDDFYD